MHLFVLLSPFWSDLGGVFLFRMNINNNKKFKKVWFIEYVAVYL